MASPDTLPVPPAAVEDKKSFELLRVWVAQEQQHVSLRSGVWEEPFAWGIMLADLAHHIANAETQSRPDLNRDEFFQELLEGFRSELANPTSHPEGELLQ